MTAEPSRAFGCAALLGIAAALPGFGYVVVHLIDTLARGPLAHATDVAALLAAGAIGPLLVVLSAGRMLRRADRPVALFVVSLVLTSVLTLLLAGFATFGPDGGGLVLACLVALLCAASAAVIAIVAAVRRRL